MNVPCSALLTSQPNITCPVRKQKPLHVTVNDDHDNHNDNLESQSGEDNLSVEVSPVLAPGSWGDYECKASNRLGHASATTSITGDHHVHDHEPKQQMVLKNQVGQMRLR